MNLRHLTKLIVIAGMIVCTSMACADAPKQRNSHNASRWNAPDSMAQAIMGNRLTDLLLNPKKVEMYTVAYRDSTRINNTLVDSEFVIDSLIRKLTKDQIAVLNYILITDSRNFTVDTMAIPMIPHRPSYAFHFKNKNDEALVWYAPGDFTWGIRYDGRNMFWYNVTYPANMNRFCRNLSNK